MGVGGRKIWAPDGENGRRILKTANRGQKLVANWSVEPEISLVYALSLCDRCVLSK